MFGIFKKKSPSDKLYAKHAKLLKEAHALSTVNRAESDKKHAEAEKILIEIEALKKV